MKFEYLQFLALATMMSLLLVVEQNNSVAVAFSASPKISQARLLAAHHPVVAFVKKGSVVSSSPSSSQLAATTTTTTATTAATGGFIETELRGAAMRLHTREQAPKEGQVEVPKQQQQQERYIPTRADYLQFLVDTKHVYEAFEEIVDGMDEMAVFRNTGLERVAALEVDIAYMTHEYGLTCPSVGSYGQAYASLLRDIAARGAVPELMCHYYNFYFAHTAGGRMIGKQMSALLLDKKTLEFYKWDGDLNEIKARVKASIEEMAAGWSRDEKDECVGATADAFRVGGQINSYLSGGGGGGGGGGQQ